MTSKNYEVGFVAENASARLKDVENFGKTIGTDFTEDVLTGLTVCLWTASDVVGFWLVFENLNPQDISKFKEWMDRYKVKVLEVMHRPPHERDRLREEFILKADTRFIGAFDMGIAFRTIERRLKEAGKIPPR